MSKRRHENAKWISTINEISLNIGDVKTFKRILYGRGEKEKGPYIIFYLLNLKKVHFFRKSQKYGKDFVFAC